MGGNRKYKMEVVMRQHYYDRPNPHSIGDTAIMYRQQRQEKEDFKREELKKELKSEDRENLLTKNNNKN